LIKRIVFSILESLIRSISGGLGQRIRRQYYKRRFKSCGGNLKIDEGVIFHNPENIEIGSNVWFLQYSIITARESNLEINDRLLIRKVNKKFTRKIGSITIGNEVSIGAYNIIQGYGGLIIEGKVTTSARVSIYSFSHYPNDKGNPSKITHANSMVNSKSISCIESPIVIKKNAWLGLNVIVFGGTVGKNSFVLSNSIVMSDLDENSYASGSPAKKIKNRFDYESK
jgi:acetyltransferase-like isoleucine patch superfamily enzyme